MNSCMEQNIIKSDWYSQYQKHHIQKFCSQFSESLSSSVAHQSPYVMRTGGSFTVVKRPGRETDLSTPSSTELKKMFYTSNPSYISVV
jgi:hypothetical protein